MYALPWKNLRQKNKQIAALLAHLHPYPAGVPINKPALERAVDILFAQLFPVRADRHRKRALSEAYHILRHNMALLVEPHAADRMLETFLAKIPDIQRRLFDDAAAFLHSDPAAPSIAEVILTYPGFFALAIHRLAHELYQLRLPVIPRLFAEYAHAKVGIDIHPGACIGDRFFMDHGTGTVIGETCVIGRHVKIYQGVTLGALYVSKDTGGAQRHPRVEDHVVIYAGATILGGNTVIGHHSTIGGNVWLTHSVAPYTLACYTSEMKMRTVKALEEPINYPL
jgi:serine O-acetyltransferase